jgi:ethanolamine utilization protein EutQ
MAGQSKVKSAIRVERFSDLKFVPRFEYGHMAELAGTCGEADGTVLGTGFVRLKKAKIPWTISYDEVLTVIEGSLKIHANGVVHELGPRDSIWLPDGSELVYETEEALITYAIHPNS